MFYFWCGVIDRLDARTRVFGGEKSANQSAAWGRDLGRRASKTKGKYARAV